MSIIVLLMPGLLSSRPLLDNRADARFFVDREDDLRVLENAIALGFNALVTGPRGAGKTSLLRRLAYRLRQRGTDSVFMDGAAVDSGADLLALLRERLFGPEVVRTTDVMKRIERIVGQREVRYRTPSSELLSLIEELRTAFEVDEDERASRESEELAEPTPRVVLLDGLPHRGAHQLFGRLRDELWTVPVTWVVAADSRQAREDLRPPADAFFEATRTLEPLDPRRARELLARRIPKDAEIDERTLEAVVEGSNGLPRDLVGALRSVIVEGRSPDAASAERDERRRRLEPLGASAVRIAEELEASGGASASDEGFLARVGLSRATAARVLRRMEDEGLVSSTQETLGSSGRPRRVYRLTGIGGART